MDFDFDIDNSDPFTEKTSSLSSSSSFSDFGTSFIPSATRFSCFQDLKAQTKAPSQRFDEIEGIREIKEDQSLLMNTAITIEPDIIIPENSKIIVITINSTSYQVVEFLFNHYCHSITENFEFLKNDENNIINSILPFFLGQQITIDEHNYKLLIKFATSLDCPSLLQIGTNFSFFFEENVRLHDMAEIQRTVMSINKDNISVVKNSILDSCLINDLEILVQFLLVAVEYRPTDNSAHCELIKILAESIPDTFLTILTNHILGKFTHQTNFFFIHELMRLNVINENDVVKAVCSSSILNAGLWFAPEVEKTDSTFIETLKDRIMSVSNPKKHDKSLLLFFESTQLNNWKLHNEYSILGFNPDPIAIALRTDDVNTFQTMSCQFNFDINQTIKPCFFERSALLMNCPTLIQYSAFYGSLKCFKYLLLNGALIDLNDKTNVGLMPFAIAGGNPEIIHICQQVGCNFTNTLSIAAEFHRYPIFNWLIESVLDSKVAKKIMKYTVFNSSIRSYNLTVSMQCLLEAQPNLTKNWTAVTDAVESGNIIMVRLFFTFRDTNFVNKSGRLLSAAAKCGNVDIAKLITSQQWFESLETVYSEAIISAVSNDSLEVLKYLETLINFDIFQISGDQNPFFTAASSGSLKCLKYLASKSESDVNQVNNNDCIALRSAISAEQIEVVKFLLSLPAIDINARTSNGGSAFTLATWKNFIVIAKLLVEHGGVEVNVRGARGETPLTSCIFNRTRRLLKYLLTLPEIDVNMPNKEGRNALLMAIGENDYPSMRILLAHPKIDVNYRNYNGETPLIFATKRSNSNAAEILLHQKGININECDDTDTKKHSALYYAALNKLTTTIIKLLSFADLEIDMETVFPLIAQIGNLEIIQKVCGNHIPNPNNLINSETLLTAACKQNNIEMIKYLLAQRDIDPNLKNGEGYFPLLIAAQQGYIDISRELLIHPKININETNFHGVCALRGAICERQYQTVAFLLNAEKNIDVSISTNYGGTAFSAAVHINSLDIVKSLVEKKNSTRDIVNNIGDLGETPLTSAVLNKSTEMVSYLLTIEEVDVNRENIRGKTPLMISAETRQIDILRILLNHRAVDINHCDKFGNCALSFGGRYKAIAKILLETNGINLNKTRILESILESGNVDNLIYLLSHCQFNLNCCLTSGDTPLVFAIKHNNQFLFDYLLHVESIDFNFKTKKGDPPLTVAILNNIDFALNLIPKCDINATNFWGETPLIIASKQLNLPIIKKLLSLPNIKVNYEGKRHFSAITEAIYYNSFEAADLLIKHGATGVNSLNAAGETSLITAIKNENIDLFQLLMSLEIIDVNKTAKDGTTALIVSMESRDEIYANMLLSHRNIDINITNKVHKSALTVCVLENKKEMIDLLISRNVVIDDYALPTAITNELVDVTRDLIKHGAKGVNNLSVTFQRPLPYAVRCKNDELVDLILSLPDIDVNVIDEDHETALTIAVYQVNFPLTKKLLTFPNIDVNMQNKDGETALRIASANRHTEFVALLLLMPNIDVNLKTKRGGTPLTGAVSANDPDSVEMLLIHGALGINDVGAIGETPLTDAIDASNITMVKFLLRQPCVDISAENAAGQTPLMKSIKQGDVDIFKIILSSPTVDVNHTTEQQHETPLTMSLYSKNTRISSLLLESPKIDVNLKNKFGKSPLIVAVEARNIEMMKKMLKIPQIDVNATDSSNYSALLIAVKENSVEYVKLLLKREDLNIFIRNEEGETLLGFAEFDAMRLLIERGKEKLLNAKFKNGDTALISAVKKNDINRVRFFMTYRTMLEMEADDANGWTALDVAKMKEAQNIVEILNVVEKNG